MSENIYVTKTFLPPQAEYEQYLKRIWDSGLITNQGPLLQEFESAICNYLNIERFHFVSNGTVALQIALSAFDFDGGEVIVTPFSYVATVSSILWENFDPVFVDIEPETFCMDPSKIEAAITPNTKAILAVHVFGNPCDVEAIEAIASRHNIVVIYDAAHAFGVNYKGKSLLSYGDISTGSFHATKLFHTIEGGAVVVKDQKISEKIELIKRFGHNGDDHFMLGINAKASEFQAAMGLCNLKYHQKNLAARKATYDQYGGNLPSSIRTPVISRDTDYNYAYYPVLFKNEATMLAAKAKLEAERIFPRRYFYPSLNVLPYIESHQKCAVSEDIASRILCLPLYAGLNSSDIERICRILSNG